LGDIILTSSIENLRKNSLPKNPKQQSFKMSVEKNVNRAMVSADFCFPFFPFFPSSGESTSDQLEKSVYDTLGQSKVSPLPPECSGTQLHQHRMEETLTPRVCRFRLCDASILQSILEILERGLLSWLCQG